MEDKLSKFEADLRDELSFIKGLLLKFLPDTEKCPVLENATESLSASSNPRIIISPSKSPPQPSHVVLQNENLPISADMSDTSFESILDEQVVDLN